MTTAEPSSSARPAVEKCLSKRTQAMQFVQPRTELNVAISSRQRQEIPWTFR